MVTTHRVTFHGPPGRAGDLASFLRDEGIEVTYSTPMEERDATGAAVQVILNMAASGATETIKVVLRRYKTKHPRATLWLDDEPITITEDEPTIRIVEQE